MKRITLTIVTLFALLATVPAVADNITSEQARDAAAHYMRHSTGLERLQADELTLVHQLMNDRLGVPSMYFFNAPECGWIIMGGSTAMDPLVAFAEEGSLDPDNFPPAMVEFLRLYNGLICEEQERDAESPAPEHPLWTNLANHQLKGNTKADNVMFLKATWDQGGSPYVSENGKTYDMYTPTVQNGNYNLHCPVGCVATALAQMCHHYQWPPKGQGVATDPWNGSTLRVNLGHEDTAEFNYSVMPKKITNGSSQAARREVSRLGYYIGVVVKMNYGLDGSGTTDYSVMQNFPYHFRYTNGTLTSRAQVGDTAFIGRLRRDLLRNRPVYMSGASQGGSGADAAGHAWLCGGYIWSNENMYYLNWGWGGSSNGFFNLVGNTYDDMYLPETASGSDPGYCFRLGQSHITNMVPPAGSVDIQSVSGHAELGSAYPNPATLNVHLPYSVDCAADLTVFNALGQPVATRRVQAGNGEVLLSVGNMPTGIYIYRLGDAYGKFVVR